MEQRRCKSASAAGEKNGDAENPETSDAMRLPLPCDGGQSRALSHRGRASSQEQGELRSEIFQSLRVEAALFASQRLSWQGGAESGIFFGK